MTARGKVLRGLISIIEFLIIASLLFSFVYVFLNAKEKGDVFDVSKGWEISIDGEEFHDVDISGFQFPKEMKDVHEIVMHHHIEHPGFPPKTLRVYTRLSFVEVDLGEEILYHSGIAEKDPDGFLGMGYHFIQIPSDVHDTDLTIRIVGVEKGAITGLPDIALTTSNIAYTYFVDQNAIGIFCSVFVFVLGLVLTIISILYTHLNRDYFRLFLVGSFALSAGFWCMCSQKILQMFGVSIASNSSMEYYLMEMIFLPIMGYNIKVREGLTGKEKLSLRILLSATLVYDIVAGVLHFCDIIHYSQFVYVFYIIAIVDCIGMLFIGVHSVSSMSRSEQIFHYALSVASLFGFWRIIDYVYGNYLVKGNPRLAGVAFPIAILAFTAAMLISYLSHLYDMVLTQAQEEALTVLAYKDTLTGLYNRVKSDELFEELNQDSESNYVFLDFDLNGLKALNDDEGHAKGDILISGFGRVLQKSFSAFGSCMRMGGDEFLVIIKGQQLPGEDELLKTYYNNLYAVSKEIQMDLDASYGIAYSSEVFEPEAEQVFRLADERMYEMKRVTKKSRGF